MADIENLVKQAVGELDRLLHARNVVGDPVVHGDVTVVPLVSFGFGFGAGGGEGREPTGSGEGSGGGTAGGGGVKPVALIVIDDTGVRLETIKGATASVWGQVAEAVASQVGGKKGGGKPEDTPAEE